MHAFMEGLFPSSLTRISLGIPTSVPPNSVKSLEHVRFIQDPCQERSQSLLAPSALGTSPFPGSLSPSPGSFSIKKVPV